MISAPLGLCVGLRVLHTTGQEAGKLLPVVEYADAIGAAGTFPPHLHGARPLDAAARAHRDSVRSDQHHDISTPLVPLATDVIFVKDDGSWRTPQTALDDTLRRHDSPRWIGDTL